MASARGDTAALTPRQAAELLGVSESTMRRWCDRALVSTGRTSGRHRRIDRGELFAFARRAGLWSGAAATLTHAGVGGRVAPSEQLVERLEVSLSRGDEAAVRTFVANALTRREPEHLFDEVLAPAMRRIGERWAASELAVYQEHRATHIAQVALAQASEVLERPRPAAPIAVCAALSGDPYALAPMMAGIVLRAERWRTMHLGPDTPADEIARAARDAKASLVVVSLGCVASGGATRRALAQVAEGARAAGAKLAVGGRGLAMLGGDVDSDFQGNTMADLRSFARRVREVGRARGRSKEGDAR